MTERTKRRIIVILPMFLFFIGVIAVSVFWMHEYQETVFEHISKFCEIIMGDNPETKIQVLSALKEYHILTEQEVNGNNYLIQYGYRCSEFCKEIQWHFLILSSVLFFMTVCGFLFSVRYIDSRNRKRILELTNYLEKVNVGAGGTIIQRSEDDFSHLQDEIYKTVTELYQTREAAVKAKINFADNLANIAHQLKTPITSAFLSLQLMRKTTTDSHAEQVKRQLERLNHLEESLLTLSEIDAGTLLLERSKVDIYTALNLAAENLSSLLEKEKISVSIPDRGCVEITVGLCQEKVQVKRELFS